MTSVALLMNTLKAFKANRKQSFKSTPYCRIIFFNEKKQYYLPVLNPKFISYEQKRHFEEGKLLPVMEAFYTLQGEGYNTGEAAFFS